MDFVCRFQVIPDGNCRGLFRWWVWLDGLDHDRTIAVGELIRQKQRTRVAHQQHGFVANRRKVFVLYESIFKKLPFTINWFIGKVKAAAATFDLSALAGNDLNLSCGATPKRSRFVSQKDQADEQKSGDRGQQQSVFGSRRSRFAL